MSRITTRYLPSLLSADLADDLFLYLKEEIDWEDGIYSKRAKAISRQGKSIDFLQDEKLLPIILLTMEKFGVALPQGVYLNYYRNGKDFAPQHTHKDTTQVVISLGCVRTLNVGKEQ